MKWYRIHNDVSVTWTVYEDVGGEPTPVDFTGKTLLLFLVAPSVEIPIKNFVVSQNIITFTFYGKDQRVTGAYCVKLCEVGENHSLTTIDVQDAFGLKPHSWQVGGQEEEDVDTYSVNIYTTIEAGVGSISHDAVVNALGGEPLLQNEVINIDCGYANGYGQSESVKGGLQVRRDTTNHWDNSIGIIPKEGEIIVYTDHIDRGEGENPRYIPGVKIGTGTAYARDLPFLDEDLRERVLDHIADMTMHITAEDRTFWNHKLNWSGTVEDGLLILNRN